MSTLTIKATRRTQSSLGGFHEAGDTIKTINLDNVARVTCKDRKGNVTIYYRNGLREIYNGNNAEFILDFEEAKQ